MMIWTTPPSTLHAAPETYDECSEHRKTIAPETSSTSASRPIGRPAAADCMASSRLESPSISMIWSARPPSSVQSSDLAAPGQIALMRTPWEAYLSAKSRERDSSAALATEYSGVEAEGRFPEELETFTMRPQPRSLIAGAAAR